MKTFTLIFVVCLNLCFSAAYCGDLDDDDDLSFVEPEDLGYDTRNLEERVFLMEVVEQDHAAMHEESHAAADATEPVGHEDQFGNVYEDGIDTDFNWGVLPYPRIYHDHGRQVTRLKPEDDGTSDEASNVIPLRGVYMIDQGSESDQHRVKDQGNLSLGVGAIGGIGSIFFAVGGIVLPIFGWGASSDRVIGDYGDAKNLERLKRPNKVEDLESWNVGDSMVYWTKGGISLLAGVSVTLANTGPGVTVNGEWLYEVKKESEIRYTVAIRRVKIANAKYRIGFFPVIRGLVGVNKNWGNNKIYSFNIADHRSHKLFNKSLKGRLRDVQYAASLNAKVVEFVEEEQSVSNDKISSFFVGFPLVCRWNVSDTRREEQTFKQNHRENLNTEIEMTTLKRGVFTKRLRNLFNPEIRKNNRYKHVAVQRLSRVSTRKTVDDEENWTERGHYGELIWTYSNDVMTVDKVYEVIKDLEKKSGSEGEIQLEFPPDMDHLGFVALEVKVNIHEGTYQRLAAKIANDPEVFKTEADHLFDKFSDPYHPMQLCRDSDGKLNEKKLRQKRKSLGSKLEQFKKTLSMTVISGLSDKEKNLKYSRLGKMAMDDPLLLAVIRSLEKIGIEKHFNISGESFRPFIKKINSDFD
ncbi:MAG: hypothetical protein AB8G05_00445 [Oligoflexales bacterium]